VLDTLRECVRDGSSNTKRTALFVLQELGKVAEPAVPDVERLLTSSDLTFAAYKTLRAIRPDGTNDPVLNRYIDAIEPGAPAGPRLAAIRAVAEMGEKGRPALWALVAQSEYRGSAEESVALIVAFSRVAPNSGLAFAGVAERYKGALQRARIGGTFANTPKELVQIARATTDAMDRIKPPPAETVGPLLSLLDVFESADVLETRAVVAKAHDMLRSLGDVALPEVLRRLDSIDAEQRLDAIHGLTVLALDSPKAMETLGDAFADTDRAVRLAAIEGAKELGPLAAPLVPKLRSVVAIRDISEGDVALEALAAIGPEARASLPALLEIATAGKNGDAFRERAALAVLKIAPEDPSAATLAPWLLQKGHFTEVFEAAPRLSEPEKLVGPIMDIATRENEEVASPAFEALAQMGPKAAGAVPALVQLLDSADNTKRVAAARVLGAIGPAAKDAAGRLGRMTDNPNSTVRRAAANSLIAIDPASPYLASAYLAAVQRRDTTLVRMLAPRVRAATGSAERILPKLTQIAASDPDSGVREVAAQALKVVGGR
jgi:hypothetical protein